MATTAGWCCRLRVAPYQVVIVPIGRENWRETVLPKAQDIQQQLVAAGIRVTLDERDERPGWKFSEWEMRGVPLRLEIGPKDIEKGQVLLARRDTREKLGVPMEGLSAKRARTARRHSAVTARQSASPSARNIRTRADDYDTFKATMEGRPGFVIAPWCGSAECEAQIKTDTQATIRNMPLDAERRQGRRACAATILRWPRPGSRSRTRGVDARLGAGDGARHPGAANRGRSKAFDRRVDHRIDHCLLIAPREVRHLDEQRGHAVASRPRWPAWSPPRRPS